MDGRRAQRRLRRRAPGGAAGRASPPEELAAEIDVVERIRSQYPLGTRLNFGAPTRCPDCGDFGLVDDADLIAGKATHRCLRCGATWTISVRALLAVDSRLHDPPAGGVPAPHPQGSDRPTRVPDPADDVEGVRFSRDGDGRVVRRSVADATTPLPTGPAAERPTGDRGRRPRLLPLAGFAPFSPAPGLPLRVLLVDDDPDDVRLVRSLVAPAGPSVIDLRTAGTRAAGELAARAGTPDLVLLDLGLPDSRGLDTLRAWRDGAGDAPVLVVGDGRRGGLDAGVAASGTAGVVEREALADYLARGIEGAEQFVDLLERSVPARRG